MPREPSGRVSKITQFIVMDVLEEARRMERAGENIIHLEIGEPDFDTPEPARKAAIAAIEGGHIKYTPSLGLPELREAISASFTKDYGVEVNPERIIVTAGSSNALFMALASLIDTGDEVIIADPCYSCYPNFIRFLGGTPVYAQARESEGFQLTMESVKRKLSLKTKAIIINSPSNPSGSMMGRHAMERLASLGVSIVSDEIYHGLHYEDKPTSILELPGDNIVINGFSKRYAMTGWRLGYAITPGNLVRPMQKLQQNLYISASSVAQWAALSAITECASHVEEMRTVFNRRRLLMIDGLERIGLKIAIRPKGAFYVFVDVSGFSGDSLSFAMEALAKAKVAVAPGVDFGPSGEGYIRLSYATSEENIKEGVRRLGAFLGR
ncbi:MAG: pyridoxal phosphate-dependent aminotransferase [Nitrospinae bacterium]|nr:pyridoxal phosphate-dependent aminotransferase [Nitrospinota bacterium]